MTAFGRSSLAATALWATLLSTTPARSWCHFNVNNFGPREAPWTSVPVYIDLGAGDLRRTGLPESTLIRYVEASIAEFNAAAAPASRLYFAGIRRPASLLYYSDLPDDSGIHIRATTCAENSCCVDPVECADDEDCDCSDAGTLCCDECVECSPHCIGGTGDAIAAQGEGKSLVRMKALQSGYAEGGIGFFAGLEGDGIDTCGSFEPWDTHGGLQTTECVGDADCDSNQECVNGVFDPNKGYCIPYKDFQGVLTHELGHVMGLGHAEWNVCQCLDEDGTHSGDIVETWGVMRSREHTAWGAGKKLYRDDIEGLRALYAPSGFPQSWSLYRWLSDQGLSWGLPVLVPGSPEQTNVPPAATSASDSADAFLVLGFTDAADYVRHYTRDAGGWHPLTASESRVDEDTQLLRPTDGQLIPAGRSFRRVAVGYAPPVQGVHPGRVMVAWVFEDDHEFKAKIRWGIRDRDDLSDDAWCYDMLTTRYRTSPGIAYDAVNERFVLSYLENNNGPGLPTMRTIDPLTCTASEPETLRPKGLAEPEGLHDIGKPVCRTIEPQFGSDRTACVIPIATTSINGPCLGWYGGDLPNGPLGTLDHDEWERKIHCVRNFGQGDLARDPWGQEGMIGTLTHFARGADPIADTSPLCGLPGCGFTEGAEAQIFLRYKLADPAGDSLGYVNQNGLDGATPKLATPTDFDFVPGTSAAAPGQPDPSPWWPGATGSVGGTSSRFHFYRTLGPVCGNGLVEDGESCDGGAGQTDCEDLGFEGGTLRCSSQCTWDTSDCSQVPGCSGSPGDPGCECLPVVTCPTGQVDEDGCYPDGPGSYLGPVDEDYHGDLGLYCPDNAGGNGSVCGTAKIASQLYSVCRTCPSLPASGAAGYGCPCRGDSDCAATGWSGPVSGSNTGLAVGLACWGGTSDGWSAGNGVCLPALDPAAPQTTPVPMAHREEFERTRWLCKSTCAAIEANTGLPHQCHFNQTFEFLHASCIEESACADTGLPGQCDHEEQGRCDQVTDLCSNECDPALNGTNPMGGNPDCQAWGYPGYWQCAAWGNPPRCVVPECVIDPLISGLDISECRQFLHGEPGPP